jgi:hypothetical protein
VVVLLALATVSTAVAATTRLPRLTVPSEHPFVVRASGFVAFERIRVTVHAGGKFVRMLVATSRGTFLVRFRSAQTDSCTGYTVSAVGNKGSRATLRLTRECPPPESP